MYSTKFNPLRLLWTVFYFPFMATFQLSAFSDRECLESQFNETVEHSSGMASFTKNKFTINKNACVIEIDYRRFRFFNTHWTIDVCRLPVHIKEGESSVDVIKRNFPCHEKERKDEFCKQYREIMDLLQDDGLTFAQGEKDLLETSHGRIFCSYKLLRAYLLEGKIFARHNEKLWEDQNNLRPVYSQETNDLSPIPTPSPTPETPPQN